jgi:hypothetical protein
VLRLPGMKGLRRFLKMEWSLPRPRHPLIPPKEDEADLSTTSAWGLIGAVQVPISSAKSLRRRIS